MGHDNKTLQLVLNVVGMIVGVFIMAAGICRFIDGGHDAINIILGVYLMYVYLFIYFYIYIFL